MADREPQSRGDESVRREITTALDRSMLVEAAAGTGKTTLIMTRLLRGLRKGTFTLPRTVAITFTEKAAGELENRLRTALSGSLRAANLSPAEESRLTAALDEIDSAHVSTIHSFCAGLLRERPVAAGVDPEFEVLDQIRADLLAQDCWERWMGRQVQEAPEALVEALRAGVRPQAGRGSTGLRGLADALMNTPEALDRSRFTLSTPDSGVEELARDLLEIAPRARDFLRDNLTTKGNKTYWKVMDFLSEVLDAGEGDLSDVRRLACQFRAGKAYKALTSLDAEARERGAALLEELATAAGLLSAHLAGRVFEWLTGFAEFCRREKASRSVLDFQDLLTLTARMLRTKPAVRQYFKGRFDAVFVDEFQDTDPLQAEIVAFLCEEPASQAERMEDVRLLPGKLFVVGDPKQSIYRFRRADVQTYERFKRLLSREDDGRACVRQVHRNFRSTPALLDGLNRVFSRVFVPPEQEGVYQAGYVALSAPPEAGSAGDEPAVLALCPPPDLHEDVDTADRARDYEAHYLALAIRSIVEDDPAGTTGGTIGYGDIACLFRALTDVDKYEDAFEKYGIPYRVVGGRTYYLTEEIGETIALLRAIDDPLDEPAIVGALRSSYFGVSDEDLLDHRRRGGRWNYLLTPRTEGPAGEALSMLAEWHRRRNAMPPQVLLEEALHRTKALEAFLLKPRGEQRAANVKKLLSQMRGIWSASHGSFGSVVSYLATLQEREAREEESSVVEPGDEFVQVMTIHKSKGLQFPWVIVPDLARTLTADPDPLLLDRSSGRVEVSVAPNVSSRGYAELAELEEKNLHAEYGRLLYVACTRAERHLLLPLHWQNSRRESLLSILEDTERFAPADSVPYGQVMDGVRYIDTRPWRSRVSLGRHVQPTAEPDEQEGSQQLLRERERWQKDRERLLQRARSAPPIIWPSHVMAGEPRPLAVGGEEPGPAGKGLGTLFHLVMREVPLQPGQEGEELEALVRRTADLHAAEAGLSENDAKEATALACAALRSPKFREVVSRARTIRREVPFCVPLSSLLRQAPPDGGFVEGTIDLLLTGREGTVILDYKTDRGAQEAMEALQDRYWPQLALYGLACRGCREDDAPLELMLYFVRAGLICRRTLDEDLATRVRETVRAQLEERNGTPSR